MSKFSLIHALQEHGESRAQFERMLVEDLFQIQPFIGSDGVVLTERLQDFLKDAREYVSYGNFPLYNRMKEKNTAEDENNDGKIDQIDAILFMSKVIGGLWFYMQKDVKTTSKEGFDMIVKGLTTQDGVADNMKAMAEKQQKLAAFAEKTAKEFKNPSTKNTLRKYLDSIESYYLKGVSYEDVIGALKGGASQKIA
jgi:hypothetical protein